MGNSEVGVSGIGISRKLVYREGIGINQKWVLGIDISQKWVSGIEIIKNEYRVSI